MAKFHDRIFQKRIKNGIQFSSFVWSWLLYLNCNLNSQIYQNLVFNRIKNIQPTFGEKLFRKTRNELSIHVLGWTSYGRSIVCVGHSNAVVVLKIV